jgi:hypothetical protein
MDLLLVSGYPITVTRKTQDGVVQPYPALEKGEHNAYQADRKGLEGEVP